jgi:hypothetical protein
MCEVRREEPLQQQLADGCYALTVVNTKRKEHVKT